MENVSVGRNIGREDLYWVSINSRVIWFKKSENACEDCEFDGTCEKTESPIPGKTIFDICIDYIHNIEVYPIRNAGNKRRSKGKW